MGGPGFVTIGRSELDVLFNKLNGLENSIAEMREELSIRRQDRGMYHEVDTNGGASGPLAASSITSAGYGRVNHPNHIDVHGVHMKNDAVSHENSVDCLLNTDRLEGRVRTFWWRVHSCHAIWPADESRER